MHIFAVTCGIISTVLAIYCIFPYFFAIARGETKPHQFTWLIWTLMNGIIAVSQFLAGARASMLISAVFFLSSAVDFGLSLKFGVRNSSRFDWLLLGLSLATIVAWALTRNNAVAIWLTVLIDVFASTMLILKIKSHPGSEPFWPWCIATIAFIFTILSVTDKPFGILYLRPAYGFVSDVAILVAILYYKPTGKGARQPSPTFPEA